MRRKKMGLTKEEKKLDIDEVIKKMEEGLITPKKAEEVLLNATLNEIDACAAVLERGT